MDVPEEEENRACPSGLGFYKALQEKNEQHEQESAEQTHSQDIREDILAPYLLVSL